MDFDYDRQNKSKIYSSDSPTSSSISSSSYSTRGQMSQLNKTPSNNDIETNMTSSTSQIFATAASFQLSQNDAVFYSRETMHLLAKFLSAQGNNQIFRSLYAFAPDNLAWLWAFFDWTTPIDINKIPSQEIYQPFRTINNLDMKLSEEHVDIINKIFINAPLIQYKYRENIMIADVYKFIEYILEIKVPQIAKSLFLLYFPRFNNHISNPLDGLMEPKLLKSNIHLIKKVDDMVISLIKSRYTNLDEYKEKILNGINLPSYIKTLLKENNFYNSDQDVFFSKDFQTNDFLNALNEEDSSSNNNNNNLDFEDLDFYLNTNKLLNNLNINQTNIDEHVSVFDEFDQNDHAPTEIASSTNKTFDYMKQLRESSINDDLDHVSFDRNRFLNNLNFETIETNDVVVSSFDEHLNGNNLIDSRRTSRSNSPWTLASRSKLNTDQSNEIKYLSSAYRKKFESLGVTTSYDNNSDASVSDQFFNSNNGTPVKEFKPSRFSQIDSNQYMSSPQKNNIPPLHIYTPKTPSNLNDYNNNNINVSINTSQEKQSVWPNESARPFSVKKSSLTQYQDTNSVPVTPPPSAKLKSTPLAISTTTVCNNNTGFNLECIGSPNFIKNNNISPPQASFFKVNNKYNEQLFIHSPPVGKTSDHYNSIYKQTNLYGSPVTRFNSNTIKQYTNNNNTNKATLNELPTFAGLKQHHRCFNSNSDITTRYGSPKPSSFLSNHQEVINYKGTTYYKNDNLLDEINNNDSNKFCNKFMSFNQQQQQHTWSGRLPPKIYIENGVYSRKVFLGGLPWDVNQNHLNQVLQKYGQVKLEVPGKDSKHPRVSAISKTPERSTPGYLYIIFDHESSVQRMLSECRKEIKNGGEHYFFTIIVPPQQQQQQQQYNNNSFSNNCNFNRRGSKAKEVEVIPWNQEDTSFVPINKNCSLPSKIDAKSTIFVGALHGMLNAQGLSKVMNEIFGEVIHASLDTDKYKYPIGSGRVTFRNRTSYVKAIKAKFVTIKANQDTYDPSPKFEKTIQIDPYLEEAKCCQCNNRSVLFCRNEYCLDYFCEKCWKTNHDMSNGGEHQSLSRNQNSNSKPVFN